MRRVWIKAEVSWHCPRAFRKYAVATEVNGLAPGRDGVIGILGSGRVAHQRVGIARCGRQQFRYIGYIIVGADIE